MVKREEVLEVLKSGGGYEAVGRALGLPAGKAYMIATGIPADYSDSLAPEDYHRPGLVLGGTQALLGVPHHNPNEPEDKPEVMDWVRERARSDLRVPSVAEKGRDR